MRAPLLAGACLPHGATLLLAIALLACQGNATDPNGATPAPPRLLPVEAPLLVPGSVVVLRGEGFLTPPAGETRVRLVGLLDGLPVDLPVEPAAIGPTQIRLALTGPLRAIFGDAGRLDGEVIVRVRPADLAVEAEARAVASLRFVAFVPPRLTGLTDSVAPGALLEATGDGFLDEGEGQAWLRLDGRFVNEADGVTTPIDGARLPMTTRTGRTRAAFYLSPGVLGLQPGRFVGAVTLAVAPAEGGEVESASLPLVLVQHGPRVDALAPAAATRGQVVHLRGEGFVRNDPAADTATLVRARGVFTPVGGAPQQAEFTFVPEAWIDNNEIQLALRSRQDAAGALIGIGATPGVFEGALAVEIFAGFDRASSPPLEGVRFEIGPPAQAVSLRYQPSFLEGLELFGLSGAFDDLRARVLAVCARDYAGLRVTFYEGPPPGWVEYVTVELGGRDPNGFGLFGLDNSPEKDVGNRQLDELIGGVNAETEAAGGLAFGGIFLESFLTLSPGHAAASPIADPAFDAVFGPFSRAIDPHARPYVAGDALDPARAAELDRAVGALANLIGSTVTHEVGHTLGLAAVEGDVHNPNDTEGGLMDRGLYRPFRERAALDDTPPGRFVGANRTYLDGLFGE